MITAKFSDFRAKAKYYFGLVENGEIVRVLRSGRPVADISPVKKEKKIPAWKKPGVKIKLNNISLSKEILKDRRKSA